MKETNKQSKWDEETHTFYVVEQLDENTVLHVPITAEEYYKNSEF